MTAEYQLGALAIEEDSSGNFDLKDDNGNVIASYNITNDEWDYQSETVRNLLIDLDGHDLQDGAAVIWDTANSQIPQGRLENDSLTVTAGDGLTNGGSVALGGSITPEVQVSDFAGTLLADDGSNNLQVQEGNISHDSIDQTSVSSDDHHTKYTDEEAQDAVGTITSGGTNVTVTYDDAANTLTIDTSALNQEEVEDAVNTLLSGGDGITTTYDDANDSLSVDTAVADFAGALLSDDGSNNLQVNESNISHDAIDQTTVSEGDHRTTEQVQDIVDALLEAGDKLSLTYDDAGNTLTVDTSALDTDEVEDAVDTLVTEGDGVATTYDDANDTLSFSLAYISKSNNTISLDAETTTATGAFETGPNELPTDTDQAILADQPVTDGLTQGTRVSYGLYLAEQQIARVQAEANGTGGIQNPRLVHDELAVNPTRGADPTAAELGEGNSTVYVSDGSADVTGDDGDVILAVNSGGAVKTTTLADFSAL